MTTEWNATKIVNNDYFMRFKFLNETSCAEATLSSLENDWQKHIRITCSVMKGCPVGCQYCSFHKFYAGRLNSNEIMDQINYIVEIENLQDVINQCQKLEICLSEMGDPFLCWDVTKTTTEQINNQFPQAVIYLVSIGPNRSRPYMQLLSLGHDISNLNIVFSLNEATDADRDKIMPNRSKISLQQLRDISILWYRVTNRPVYLNYMVNPYHNDSQEKAQYLQMLFSPVICQFIFSSRQIDHSLNAASDFQKFFPKTYTSYLCDTTALYNNNNNSAFTDEEIKMLLKNNAPGAISNE